MYLCIVKRDSGPPTAAKRESRENRELSRNCNPGTGPTYDAIGLPKA